MAKVTLKNLRKEYPGAVVALRDFTLTVADGEFVTLVGPSGCGKSTTLNLIAGLEIPTAGEVQIDGVKINDEAPRERDVAMVFQDYALYPHMTVRQNVAFPLKFSKISKREGKALLSDTVAKLGIDGLLDRLPKELSGGQRQRVALARALVRRPKAFLFDEPLSNLDPALRMELRRELKQLHVDLRPTFIYVTHDQSEAMTLSDRIVVLKAGEVQQVGAPGDIYQRPANTFVAGFFGWPRINLLKADDPSIPAILADRFDQPALVGIRPEDLDFGIAERPEGALQARVELVEPVGAESWVTVSCNRTRLSARAPSTLSVSVGDLGWVKIDPSKVHGFDQASGDLLQPLSAASA